MTDALTEAYRRYEASRSVYTGGPQRLKWSDLQSWACIANCQRFVGEIELAFAEQNDPPGALIKGGCYMSAHLRQWYGGPHPWRAKPSRKLTLFAAPVELMAPTRRYLDRAALELSRGDGDTWPRARTCLEFALMEMSGLARLFGFRLQDEVEARLPRLRSVKTLGSSAVK